MTFQEFIKTTSYAPVYAAQQVLYKRVGRVARMAKNLGLEFDENFSRADMVKIASGKTSLDEIIEKNQSTTANPTLPSESGENAEDDDAVCSHPKGQPNNTAVDSMSKNKPRSQRENLTPSPASSCEGCSASAVTA